MKKELWYAVDNNGQGYLHEGKPVRAIDEDLWVCKYKCYMVDGSIFGIYIGWEDEPIKIEIEFNIK